MYFLPERGFTLIELLVVIAIIGMLASIVLAALGNTRQQGADTGIKGNLNTIRTQAIVYEVSAGTYASVALGTTTGTGCYSAAVATNLFGASPTIKQALTNAQAASGGTVTCAANGTYWAAAVQLKTDTTQAWCVSSTGQAKAITNASALTIGNTCL